MRRGGCASLHPTTSASRSPPHTPAMPTPHNPSYATLAPRMPRSPRGKTSRDPRIAPDSIFPHSRLSYQAFQHRQWFFFREIITIAQNSTRHTYVRDMRSAGFPVKITTCEIVHHAIRFAAGWEKICEKKSSSHKHPFSVADVAAFLTAPYSSRRSPPHWYALDRVAAEASQPCPGFTSLGVLHTLHRRDDEWGSVWAETQESRSTWFHVNAPWMKLAVLPLSPEGDGIAYRVGGRG